VGIALFLLGVPNAALWAFLAMALRFIPCLGLWVAAAFPIALAFAISDGWSLVIWTCARPEAGRRESHRYNTGSYNDLSIQLLLGLSAS
jgi:hypothetical protein